MSSPLSDLSDEVVPTTKSKAPRAISDDEDVEDVRSEASSSPAVRKRKQLRDMFSDDDEDEVAIAPRSPSASPRKRIADDEDGDSEEEAVQRRRRASPAGSAGDDDGIQGDDLFGEDSDDDMKEADTPKRVRRTLDDEDLDSGDDLDASPSRRRTAGGMYDDEIEEERVETSYEVDIGLHRLPQSTDDEVYLLTMPRTVSISPSVFIPDEFQAPAPTDSAITPYHAATTAIRWRKNAKDPKKMESNSRVIQWSDGSLSLQIGSSKESLYDLPSKELLPPKGEPYRAEGDSFTFLAEPLATSRLIRCFSHATKSLNVVPASTNASEDIKRILGAYYEAAVKKPNRDTERTVQLTYRMEDPERARREVEAAVKLREKYERTRKARELSRENGEMNRTAYRSNRGFGRTGSRGTGMTAADLEEDEDMGMDRLARREKGSGGGRGFAGRRQREDEYDSDDGFVEADPDSDEEVESVSSEASHRKKSSKSKSHKSSKRRSREEEEEEEEEEAEFTDDDLDDAPRPSKSAARAESEDLSDEGLPSGKHERKRRRVVVADESDEE